MNIDIFCVVVDNYGDIGFVYRFAKEYRKHYPSSRIRIFIDDLVTLAKINSLTNPNEIVQIIDGITYINMHTVEPQWVQNQLLPELIIEAFGCDIPKWYIPLAITQKSRLWINLEHLSAEPWIEDYHRKESLLNISEPHILRKYFFMPGFTSQSGGILIGNSDTPHQPRTLSHILSEYNIKINCNNPQKIIATIFSYEYNFTHFIDQILQLNTECYLLIMGQKTQDSFRNILEYKHKFICIDNKFTHFIHQNTHIIFMPFVSQEQYDELLEISDFNFVRGEDSWVRAILTGKPFIWQAYKQTEQHHVVKLDAFLTLLKPYFSDLPIFEKYCQLSLAYNTQPPYLSEIYTPENFLFFFENIQKLGYYTTAFKNYLINHCNLIKNFIDFIEYYNKKADY